MENQTNNQPFQQTPPASPPGGPPSGPVHDNAMLMGILCYVGPLVIIPLLVSKDNAFVKYHIKQGLVVLCIEVIVWILASIVWIWWVINILNLATLALSILGIVNVVNKKEKELPLVGGFARHFTF